MQIVDDGAAAQIEEILAYSPIAGASSLPSTDMREGMLNCHAFAQFAATFGCLLSLA
jgi:hypothetical protein